MSETSRHTGKVAFVFSGQGDQYPGMGKELYERSPAARNIFQMCDRLRPGTSLQCFSATKDELRITANTQPCLFAMELALAESLREIGLQPDMAAGFSMGEVTALTFAGVFDYETGFTLIRHRGRLMQEAVSGSDLAMYAVLRMTPGDVEKICGSNPGVYSANFNSPRQTVIAGDADALDKAVKEIASSGGKAIKLSVSGAFHTPYMKEASERFQDLLTEIFCRSPHTEAPRNFSASATRRPSIPVYSNVTAVPYPDDILPLLAEQIQRPVRWEELIRKMIAHGAAAFVEIGPGKTLTNLIHKIDPEVEAVSGIDRLQIEKILCRLNN